MLQAFKYCQVLVFFFYVSERSIFKTPWWISTKFSHKVDWLEPYWKWASSLESFGSHLGKTLFSHNYDCSCCTDSTGVAFTSAQALTVHCLQCIDFIYLKMIWYTRAPGGLILSSSSFSSVPLLSGGSNFIYIKTFSVLLLPKVYLDLHFSVFKSSGVEKRFRHSVWSLAHGPSIPCKHHLPQQAGDSAEQTDRRRTCARLRDVCRRPCGGHRIRGLQGRLALQVQNGEYTQFVWAMQMDQAEMIVWLTSWSCSFRMVST